MNFLTPTSLFLFGLAIPIIALYILKLRRRREPVSTLMFWEQLFKERQTTSLFQRLKHLLSLLLQLLFLALLVFAVARPQFAFITKSARQLILIIDHSASMNAVLNLNPDNPSSESRLDSAKQQALEMVKGLRFMDEMSVISCNTRPVIHTPFTNHQKTLREAIESIKPTDVKTDLKSAVDLAFDVAQTKPNPEIVILSDFQSVSEETLEKFQKSIQQNAAEEEEIQDQIEKIKLHLIRVGEDTDNVGITQFRVRKSIVNAFDYETLLTVVNASNKEKKCSVELYFNESLFDVRPYTLAPGEKKSEIFSNFTFEGGELKAVLDITDALPTDNVAYATLPKRELISVLLVTNENPFLQKVLSVDEKLNLSIMTPAEYESGAKDAQVVVFDRFSPTTLGDGNYMFIYPPKANEGETNPVATWNIGEALETPIITDWERTHPILRHVHLENVLIGEAYEVTPPSTAQILARSFESPVLFVDVTPKRKIVFAAINILESDLPLRIAFPVIIANTIQWFQQSEGIQEYHLHTGEVLRYKVDSQTNSDAQINREEDTLSENSQKILKVNGPGEKSWDVPVENDEILFDQTLHAGFYELTFSDKPAADNEDETTINNENESTNDNEEADEQKQVWAVNLASETESNIGIAEGIEDLLAESDVLGSGSFFRYPPWIYLVFLAVILSVVEWFLYQRRKID
ncbi:MAG: BatA and WFA domain-containing protein [Candidatus Poribacteria bacterium]|nr:BatA and WFA domain-containing protein [Candidatus Poribacteria bacterium]